MWLFSSYHAQVKSYFEIRNRLCASAYDKDNFYLWRPNASISWKCDLSTEDISIIFSFPACQTHRYNNI